MVLEPAAWLPGAGWGERGELWFGRVVQAARARVDISCVFLPHPHPPTPIPTPSPYSAPAPTSPKPRSQSASCPLCPPSYDSWRALTRCGHLRFLTVTSASGTHFPLQLLLQWPHANPPAPFADCACTPVLHVSAPLVACVGASGLCSAGLCLCVCGGLVCPPTVPHLCMSVCCAVLRLLLPRCLCPLLLGRHVAGRGAGGHPGGP